MIRSMDSHQYAPAPYTPVGYDGAVRTEMVNNVPTVWAISRPTSYPASPYPAQPAMARGMAVRFQPATPNLMMDPTDSATWQRPYRFTS